MHERPGLAAEWPASYRIVLSVKQARLQCLNSVRLAHCGAGTIRL